MNYFIADTHFSHSAILNFDHRPFADMYQMEETMVMLWNATVRKSDTVYILGDFCWGKADEWLRILRQLNGTKVLIKGNHDLDNYPEELSKQFAEIVPYKEIVDRGTENLRRKVILCHYPMPFYKHSNNSKYYMLCGHVHSTHENDYLEDLIKELRKDTGGQFQPCGQIYNVGCMMPWMQYTPRTLDEIIKRWEQEHVEEG